MSFLARLLRQVKAYAMLLWRAVACRGWTPPSSMRLPLAATTVHLMLRTVDPTTLAAFNKLIPPCSSPTDTDAATGAPDLSAPTAPGLFMLSQAFPCVLECLAALPFPVLGGVLNRRATHVVTLLGGGEGGDVSVVLRTGEKLLHSARMDPGLRLTGSGHLELDVHVETKHVLTGTTLLRSTLTLVKLFHSKPARNLKGPAPAPGPTTTSHQAAPATAATTDTTPPSPPSAPLSAPQAGQVLLQELCLPERLGPAWALLDGDLSPMHLSALGARLAGFKGSRGPVANVHCVTAQVEACLLGGGGLVKELCGILRTHGSGSGTYQLSLEFKRPVLLPAQLELRMQPTSSAPMLPAGGHGSEEEEEGPQQPAGGQTVANYKLSLRVAPGAREAAGTVLAEGELAMVLLTP